VVDGTVYAGSWDTNFYALDLGSGRLRWKFQLSQQHAVTPYPGQNPRDVTSDGGLVTSSAWYEPGSGNRPDLVIFGGGYTLYALDAHTGALYWRHDYTGRPDLPPRPDVDGARIFSSPVVVGDKVLIGVSVDGQKGHRGYVVAANLADGNPKWTYETDVAPQGGIQNDGCGSVWSSGSVTSNGLVVFNESDCHFSNPPPTSETVFALRISDGHLAWRFRPSREDTKCDFDFGATANVGLSPKGGTTFLGVGGKDGTYYSLDPSNGRMRWSTNVVFGGFSGGFIATSAYDGSRVYGSTALGDFGRFESHGPQLCQPGNPADTESQQPSAHSFEAPTGKIAWQTGGAQSFAPTTVADGLTFNGLALMNEVDVRDAGTGNLLATLPIQTANWGGIATVGNAIVFGTGSSYQGIGDGISAFTPGGVPPMVPSRPPP
jgi:outer membrane protein assembly factor BamB